MRTYRAILFAPDGDFVTDFRSDTKEEVWDKVNDMGSRWIFYPIVFVATDKSIVDSNGVEHLQGKRIATVQKYIADRWEQEQGFITDALNEGVPLEYIY